MSRQKQRNWSASARERSDWVQSSSTNSLRRSGMKCSGCVSSAIVRLQILACGLQIAVCKSAICTWFLPLQRFEPVRRALSQFIGEVIEHVLYFAHALGPFIGVKFQALMNQITEPGRRLSVELLHRFQQFLKRLRVNRQA